MREGERDTHTEGREEINLKKNIAKFRKFRNITCFYGRLVEEAKLISKSNEISRVFIFTDFPYQQHATPWTCSRKCSWEMVTDRNGFLVLDR